MYLLIKLYKIASLNNIGIAAVPYNTDIENDSNI